MLLCLACSLYPRTLKSVTWTSLNGDARSCFVSLQVDNVSYFVCRTSLKYIGNLRRKTLYFGVCCYAMITGQFKYETGREYHRHSEKKQKNTSSREICLHAYFSKKISKNTHIPENNHHKVNPYNLQSQYPISGLAEICQHLYSSRSSLV